MTAQVLFFDVFFEEDPHLNAIEPFGTIIIKMKIRIKLPRFKVP